MSREITARTFFAAAAIAIALAAMLSIGALLASASTARAATVTLEDPPGKIQVARAFGRETLGGAEIRDVAAIADGSLLIATRNLPFRGADGAAVARLDPDLSPDRDFGERGAVNGRALGIGGSRTSSAAALLVLADGRILVAGETGKRPRSKPQIYIARLLESGEPDPDFGENGVRTLDPAPGRERVRRDGLATQPDGSMVLAFDVRKRGAGRGAPRLGVTRLGPAGELDPSFGTDGATLIPPRLLRLGGLRGSDADAIGGYDLATDSAGRIAVVASERIDRRPRLTRAPTVVRLSPDGALSDDAATTLGARRAARGRYSSHATAIAFDAADRVVVGGGAWRERRRGPLQSYLAVHRLTGDGKPDRRFARRGTALLRVGSRDPEAGLTDLTVGPGGRIVAAGSYAGPGGGGIGGSTVVAGVDQLGRPDRSLGRRGIFRIPPNRDPGAAVALDPAARIIAAGSHWLSRLG